MFRLRTSDTSHISLPISYGVISVLRLFLSTWRIKYFNSIVDTLTKELEYHCLKDNYSNQYNFRADAVLACLVSQGFLKIVFIETNPNDDCLYGLSPLVIERIKSAEDKLEIILRNSDLLSDDSRIKTIEVSDDIREIRDVLGLKFHKASDFISNGRRLAKERGAKYCFDENIDSEYVEKTPLIEYYKEFQSNTADLTLVQEFISTVATLRAVSPNVRSVLFSLIAKDERLLDA